MMNPYIGHESQLYGVEEIRLVGGKGDGMRLLRVRNATGIAFDVAVDRCADIYRLSFKGDNMGYFAPCGHVAPSYYQEKGKGFLKSFTAGFWTTCGLNNVGAPAMDDGEELPLHGTIANTPALSIRWEETEKAICIHARIHDEVLFGRKLVLNRTITCGKFHNYLTVTDSIDNHGDKAEPLRLMYHINMGYPLLTENAQLVVPSTMVTCGGKEVTTDCWKQISPPKPAEAEVCYCHFYDEMPQGSAAIYNPEICKGLKISFSPKDFPSLIQWNKFAHRDYALGLEPRNCRVGNRSASRQQDDLLLLLPGERKTYRVNIDLFETEPH